ncbi:GGDEF domain-containing protein [Terriglobus sp.]|uniref:GGDEF domain-containing protein n=1 Tax=Terriglobus sp. TaxID=1889013 RepID=UPI003AFF6199
MLFRKSQREQQLAFERALQQDYSRLFVELGRALTSNLELELVLNSVMNKMAEFIGPERWSLMLIDKQRQELFYAISVGENAASLAGLRVPLGEGVAGWVAVTGSPMVVPDTSVEPRWMEWSQHTGLSVHSMACVPVVSAQGVIGVVQLLNPKIDLLSDHAIQFLRVLCDFSAIAVRNAEDMKRIYELSISDDCTGLFNARHLYTLMGELFASKQVPAFSLVFMDLDHFKEINDTYGHLVGSRLLREVGGLIHRVSGPRNPAFRYGGDEFVLLLPGYDKAAAIELVKRLYYALRDESFLRGERLDLRLRGSFGLASFPDDGGDMEAMIKASDSEMYKAKEESRDNIAVAGMGMLFPRNKGVAPRRSLASDVTVSSNVAEDVQEVPENAGDLQHSS